MLLPTIVFFMIIIIYYLLQPEDIVIKADPVPVDNSFKLDYPPKNIGCSNESKPLSTINDRLIDPIYCQKI